jgi:hypothetical protein
MRFLPEPGAPRERMINAALGLAGLSTLLLATLFLLGLPLWAAELGQLSSSWRAIAIFLGSCLAFSLAQLLDKVFIALEAAHIILARTVLASSLRLLALLALYRMGELALILSLGISALASLASALLHFLPQRVAGYRARLSASPAPFAGKLGYTLGNHLAVLLWGAPALLYPMLVVAVLDAEASAYFYTSWMLANVLFIIPAAISTSLVARAASQQAGGERLFVRATARTLLLLLPCVGLMLLGQRSLLRIFGERYSVGGGPVTLYLLLSSIPYTANSFIVAYYRYHQATGRLLAISTAVIALCFLLSAYLASSYQLAGIGMGWLAGQALGLLLIAGGFLSARAAGRGSRAGSPR